MLAAAGPLEVQFTIPADAEVVKYNFFKMCFNLLSPPHEAIVPCAQSEQAAAEMASPPIVEAYRRASALSEHEQSPYSTVSV